MPARAKCAACLNAPSSFTCGGASRIAISLRRVGRLRVWGEGLSGMTLSIAACDADSGLLGVAQATNALAVGARCPAIRSGVGAVSSQAFTDPGLAHRAIELLAQGHAPEAVIGVLRGGDPHFAWRQIGIVDRHGRAAVHTGDHTLGHKAARTGEGYVVMGNLLAAEHVVPAMERAWHDSAGVLFEERLMRALTAGRDAGGDAGGHRSACLIVHDGESYGRTDLRVDFAPKRPGLSDAVDQLWQAFERYRPLIAYYKLRPHDPAMPGWSAWLKAQGVAFED